VPEANALLRSAYRAAKSKSDLSALKIENGGKFTLREHIWVHNWLKHFFPDELIHIDRLLFTISLGGEPVWASDRIASNSLSLLLSALFLSNSYPSISY
jgi:hypothetical protein